MSRPARWTAVVAVAFVLPLAVLVDVGWHALITWDARVDGDLHAGLLHHRWLVDAARWVTHVGDPLVVTVLTFVVAAVLARSHRRAAVYLLVVRAVAVGLDTGLKAVVDRARPVLAHPFAHAHGHSFPSGHALGSAALWGSLALLAWRAGVRAAAVAAAALVPVVVAATRVLLGVHFVTDVAAGLVLGWAVAVCLGGLAGGTRRGVRGGLP